MTGFKHNQVLHLTLCILVLACGGCESGTNSPALTSSQLQNLKTPLNLKELEQRFGPHHSATSKQSEALMATINHMPDQVRKNAIADKTVAWGNDDGYLVGKVNDQGTVWVISYHHQN